MNKIKFLRSLHGLWILCLPMVLYAVPHYPKYRGFVTDAASVIDTGARQTLETRLANFDQATTNEIMVVTIPSLEGETIETYAVGLFNTWKIGKKGKDNGVLILIAPNERKVRIEVGYGLEPVLPDGLAGEIIREEFIPAFKAGRFGDGASRGAERVMQIVQKGEVYTTRPLSSGNLAIMGKTINLSATLFLLCFILIGAFAAGTGAGSRVFFLLLWGSFFGGLPLAMSGGLAGHLIQGGLAALAAVLFGLGYRVGHANAKGIRASARSGDTGASGWIWGGSSGGGGGGFGGGGGGGGGSSGGGGASGGW